MGLTCQPIKSGIHKNSTEFSFHKHGRGFTLIEVLVTIGLVAILLALVVPRLSRSRAVARQTSDLERVRDVGAGILVYSSNNRDRVPEIFPPVYVNPTLNIPWQDVVLRGTPLNGAWFTNGLQYHLLFDPIPPVSGALAAGAPNDASTITIGGYLTARNTDFALSDSFYADPFFWSAETQKGPEQWRAQRLTDVLFPSAKGLVAQRQVYGRTGFERGFPSCCADEVQSVVGWSDHSATLEVIGRLKPGIVNNWHYGIGGVQPPDANGPPISQTRDGIRGRDR